MVFNNLVFLTVHFFNNFYVTRNKNDKAMDQELLDFFGNDTQSANTTTTKKPPEKSDSYNMLLTDLIGGKDTNERKKSESFKKAMAPPPPLTSPDSTKSLGWSLVLCLLHLII